MEWILLALPVLAIGVPIGRFAPWGGGMTLCAFGIVVVAGTVIGGATAGTDSAGLAWLLVAVFSWIGCTLLVGGYLLGLFWRVFALTGEDES